MKKLFQFSFVVLFFIILFACNKDEAEVLHGLDDLVGAKIGYFENNTFVFETPRKAILDAFKEQEILKKGVTNPVDLKVIIVDNKAYLRVYHDDESASTIALIPEQNGNARKLPSFIFGDAVCKSKDCPPESNTGCIPQGKNCTHCIKGTNNDGTEIKGDCRRTLVGN